MNVRLVPVSTLQWLMDSLFGSVEADTPIFFTLAKLGVPIDCDLLVLRVLCCYHN